MLKLFKFLRKEKDDEYEKYIKYNSVINAIDAYENSLVVEECKLNNVRIGYIKYIQDILLNINYKIHEEVDKGRFDIGTQISLLNGNEEESVALLKEHCIDKLIDRGYKIRHYTRDTDTFKKEIILNISWNR